MRCLRVRSPHSIDVLFLLVILLSVARNAPAQTETVLYSFMWGTDGANPAGVLAMDEQGNLYGTTESGGIGNLGTVFELTPTGVETVLYHNFSGWRGWPPGSALVRDGNGNLYGTAFQGGHAGCNNRAGCGTVFRVRPEGTGTVLHHFKAGQDGWGPNGGLVLDSAGNLYGTTVYGGTHSGGTVFQITPNRTERVLHSFAFDHKDGLAPAAGLVHDGAGNLYGTTRYGGPNLCGGGNSCGTVFEITSAGEEKVLYAFTGEPDGSNPAASLVLDSKGNLYGTTETGGDFGCGTVFELNAAGVEKVLYSFRVSDGCYPTTGLVRDRRGRLYGTTTTGGAYGQGTVFEVTPAGKKKVLHSFSGYPDDGSSPLGALVLDAQGNLYGTTMMGGASHVGTVFKLTP